MAVSPRRRLRTLGLAGSAAALALALLPTPAGAYSTAESGLVGEYSYSESSATPFATCGYAGPVGPSNWIWIRWVRVTAPTVMAADRNSARRERRVVSFRLTIQRTTFGSGNPWRAVRSSKVQKAPAYDDQAAALSPIKLSYTPKHTLANGQHAIFRAMVVVKWLTKDGKVEGTAKMWPSYYRINSPYFSKPYPTGGNPFCPAVSTDG